MRSPPIRRRLAMNNHDLEALIASLRDGARRGLAPRETPPLVDALGLPAQLAWEREAYDDRYRRRRADPTGDGTLSTSLRPTGRGPGRCAAWGAGPTGSVRVNETLLRALEAIRWSTSPAQAPLRRRGERLPHPRGGRGRADPAHRRAAAVGVDPFRARRGLLTEADTAAWRRAAATRSSSSSARWSTSARPSAATA